MQNCSHSNGDLEDVAYDLRIALPFAIHAAFFTMVLVV